MPTGVASPHHGPCCIDRKYHASRRASPLHIEPLTDRSPHCCLVVPTESARHLCELFRVCIAPFGRYIMNTQLSSRSELRHTSRQNGTYLKSLTNGDRTTFEDGPVVILNKSENGALLRMSRPFHAGDTIEVQWRQPGEQSTSEVFEVRWSQQKRSSRYIIGCRLIFSTEWIKTQRYP